MADPGDDLKKVIAFREKIVEEKKILFQSFSTHHDLEQMTRRCIEEYVRTIKTADARSESSQISTAPSRDDQDSNEGSSNTADPFSTSGYTFLAELAGKLRQDSSSKDVSSFDVARLRLLANSISRTGNHEMTMGAHDLNVSSQLSREVWDLSRREILCLSRLGLQYMSSENVPFWRWYSLLLRMKPPVTDVAIWSTIVRNNDEERLGAFRVLTALGREIRVDSETITREWIIQNWFSNESSARVRSAGSFLYRKVRHTERLCYSKERNTTRTTKLPRATLLSVW